MCNNEIETESESFIDAAEWCPKPNWSVESIKVSSVGFEARPRRRGTSRPLPEKYEYNKTENSWEVSDREFIRDIPETLPAYKAVCWAGSEAGVDFRPHLFDPVMKTHLLVDSGSQISAFPSQPGDAEVKGQYLKAVNGSRIKCYGRRKVMVKIGRKEYWVHAYIADVEKPILGWDFIRQNKLDIVWNSFGDNVIIDKVAKVSQVLEFRSMSVQQSLASRKLAFVSSSSDDFPVQFQVAAMQALPDIGTETMEDVSLIPDSSFKQILLKYPDILKQNFKSDSTKSGIVHRIKLKENAKPFKSK